jgi:hypothetical protein
VTDLHLGHVADETGVPSTSPSARWRMSSIADEADAADQVLLVVCGRTPPPEFALLRPSAS